MPLPFSSRTGEGDDNLKGVSELAEELEQLTSERQRLKGEQHTPEVQEQLRNIEERRKELRKKLDALG